MTALDPIARARSMRRERDLKMVAAWTAGHSHTEIARAFQLSRENVKDRLERHFRAKQREASSDPFDKISPRLRTLLIKEGLTTVNEVVGRYRRKALSKMRNFGRKSLQEIEMCFPVNRLYQHYAAVPPYITKDGSEIRELMHPAVQGNRNQSLAEATLSAGTRTMLHRHLVTEEIYHITAGEGQMTLGADLFKVGVGDTICIAPGTAHCIAASTTGALVLLCCCSPAYSHTDTEILETGQED
ncbi:MAG: cupin domain-containing protein [Candidatus Accumulibacter sp.]|uniref:Thermophilic glucose-6-phosphate isomerase n=1 Tax=Candidatus Accumulibacter cognatus TaxID=2954383 RepID=A0A080M3A2_9PROT|nr:MAG: Thermophilic glucose-6-phosphate isomerase [Candidatus Accumulibacter cognatus]MBN8520135.1 cupin domain-containing protein [Accumulibacter sp.]